MVGMFHELHCLRVLNFAFDRSHKATGDHVHHCLNYLRQMALCSADVTLEPGDFTKRNFDGSRTGSVHVCRDWSALYDAMEENWDQWEDVDVTTPVHTPLLFCSTGGILPEIHSFRG